MPSLLCNTVETASGHWHRSTGASGGQKASASTLQYAMHVWRSQGHSRDPVTPKQLPERGWQCTLLRWTRGNAGRCTPAVVRGLQQHPLPVDLHNKAPKGSHIGRLA